MNLRARWILWACCGLGIAAVAMRLAHLSRAFVWGDEKNFAARPILEVVAWWLVAWLLYAGALRLGAALPPRLRSLALLVLVGGLARAMFFGTNPIQEDDAYRYLWDGQQVLEGVNPYRHSPAEVLAATEATGDLATLAAARAASPAARENFRKINNKSVPTVYPPLNMVVFAACQKVAPWKLDGLRAAFLLFELATIVLVWFALRAAGANPLWTAVYAWCPLPIKELANSPHHDALVVLMLAAFLLFAVSEMPRLAALFLALATASKLYPVLVLPVLIVWAWRRAPRSVPGVALVFVLTLAVVYGPFLDPAMFRGTRTFATEWQSNAGAFALIEWIWSLVLPRPDLPMNFFGGQAERAAVAARLTCFAIIVAGAAFAAAHRRFHKPDIAPVGRPWDLPFRAFVALGFLFAFSPAQHPWYFCGLLPFVALFPFRSWVMLTGLFALYYARFYVRYHYPELEHDRRNNEIRCLEWIPFYLALVTETVVTLARAWFRNRASA